jgi:hypothetical protein
MDFKVTDKIFKNKATLNDEGFDAGYKNNACLRLIIEAARGSQYVFKCTVVLVNLEGLSFH